MSKLTVLPHPEFCPDGKVIEVTSEELSVCEILLSNNINIEHACGMVCACTTCHIIVTEGFDSLNKIDESEDDMLDKAWGLSSSSRLSCQTKIMGKDITIEIPKYTVNHAKEKY